MTKRLTNWFLNLFPQHRALQKRVVELGFQELRGVLSPGSLSRLESEVRVTMLQYVPIGVNVVQRNTALQGDDAVPPGQVEWQLFVPGRKL